MPTWGKLLEELKATAAKGGGSEFDTLRRKYLGLLAKKTGNNVISYSTGWTSENAGGPVFSINPEDVQGFMEVVHGLQGDNLDLILHSPGGSAETTEAIVSYLRQKFKRIRVFVPQAAMSAATMLACAADELVLAKHSSIGPIDPQMFVRVEGQVIMAPAAAIQEQYQQAHREIAADPSRLPAWIPLLRQYGPALLAQCRYAEQLSKELVQQWLAKWMFKDDPDRDKKAEAIASHLASHANFNSHGRFIDRDKAKGFGLKIADLEDDQVLQDLVLSVFHAATITHSATPAKKIIENHLGRCYLKLTREEITINVPFKPPPGTGGAPTRPSSPLLAPPNIRPMFPPKKKP